MSRQTQAIIDADALVHNFTLLSGMASGGNTMAVIKADAYGHGAVAVARILKPYCQGFAVAITEEAITLREAGIEGPIVILEGPHQQAELELASDMHFIPVVHQHQQLAWLNACAQAKRPKVWFKIDSGMHRLGFSLQEIGPVVKQYTTLFREKPVLITHLACADETDNHFTAQQIHDFENVIRETQCAASIANSPAVVGWPQSHGDWNRVGIAMYGAQPLSKKNTPLLQPVMTLQASIIAIRHLKQGDTVGYGQQWKAKRPSVIATVGIGYADGYPRHCPNGTPVYINGYQGKLAGRVSMDMISVDITDIPLPAIGDTVELWGKHLLVDDVARCAGTISYELLARISPRVPRLVRWQS
ncbi:alanine racemase [Aestuariibacter sp. A3R04]|uniref:alanine racemase n=1 Tax=Aestuariibacter sp. A3R04 TaxID=2841571 RepID=UPI001C080D62|nr:alanine racemase [Aestuariibacter sp. A3R04]MBU3023974.1 alanine racemase [Aestuariibacter sp. A3R04]